MAPKFKVIDETPAAAPRFKVIEPAAEEPMPPYDLTSDIGPDSDGPMPQDPILALPEPLRREFAKQEGNEDAIPFLRDLEAAMTSAFTDKDYDTAKSESMARRDALREEFPWEYHSRNLPLSVGVGYLTQRMGGPKVRGIGVPDLIAMYGQAENHGAAGPSDIITPIVAGGAIAGGARAGLQLVKAIGKALQVPLNIAEELFSKFGASRMAKMIAGADDTAPGRVISERVKALSSKIDAADSFVGAPGPKIEIKGDADARAFSAAQDMEGGLAEFGPGPGDFTGDPALFGDMADAAAREAVEKNYPHLPRGGDVGDLLDDAHAPLLQAKQTKKELLREQPFAELAGDGLGDHSAVVVGAAAPKVPRLKSKGDAFKQIKDAIGLDDHDTSKADVFYERWLRGEGPKPPPFEGPHFDDVNNILGLKGAKRVSGAREAFDRIMADARTWEDVEDGLQLLRTIPGFEKARLPDAIQEAMLAARQPAERSASFNFGANVRPEPPSSNIAHKGEFRGPTGKAKDKPRLVQVPPEGEGSFMDDWGLSPANEADLVSGVHQRRVRLDDSALEPGVREESELSREYFDRVGRREPVSLAPVDDTPPAAAKVAREIENVDREIAAREPVWKATGERFQENMRMERELFVRKAKQYRALLQQAKAIEGQNKMEAERLRGVAEQARAELDNIARGRRATEKLAGAVTGWKVGSVGGILGQIGGASAGYKHGAPVGLSAEVASAAGQKLSSWAAANAESWAARGDRLGKLAQWALSGTGEQQELRMFMLGQAAADLGAEDQSEENDGTTASP